MTATERCDVIESWSAGSSGWTTRYALIDAQCLSARTKSLLAVAWCRRIDNLIAPEKSRAAVDGAEMHADGLLRGEKLCALLRRATPSNVFRGHVRSGFRSYAQWAAFYAAHCAYNDGATRYVVWTAHHAERAVSLSATDLERCQQAQVLGDFLPPDFSFNPDWRTFSVLALAQGIYADKAFDRYPILADALQDAGMGDTPEQDAFLQRMRERTERYRGDWIVDEILRKR